MKKFQLVNWVPTKLGRSAARFRVLRNPLPVEHELTGAEIPVDVPDHLSLDTFLSAGRQAGEEELDTDASACELTYIPFSASSSRHDHIELTGTATGPDIDATAVSQLEAMGFPTIRCQKALLATGNNGAEVAMGWLFEHMEDPGTSAVQRPLIDRSL
jgi:ubiquitin carboxyl-terminal hydrolase 5/13